MPTLVVGVAALALVFGIKIFASKVPGALVAVILGIVLVITLALAVLTFNLREDAEYNAQYAQTQEAIAKNQKGTAEYVSCQIL